jgi:hypothetical protein
MAWADATFTVEHVRDNLIFSVTATNPVGGETITGVFNKTTAGTWADIQAALIAYHTKTQTDREGDAQAATFEGAISGNVDLSSLDA